MTTQITDPATPLDPLDIARQRLRDACVAMEARLRSGPDATAARDVVDICDAAARLLGQVRADADEQLSDALAKDAAFRVKYG